MSNNKAFIFALCDSNVQRISGNSYNTGFIYEKAFVGIIDQIMKSRNLLYNFVKPEFLQMKFHNRAEFDQKLSDIGIKEADISIVLKVLNLELYSYQLFSGVNIGYELFNGEDD